MELIDKKPIIDFIKRGLNNPNKEEAFGHDAIQILAEIAYAPTFDFNLEEEAKWIYWSGWCSNHDKRIDDAKCSKCGYKHQTVKGSPKLLDDYCPNCKSKMTKE